MKGGKLQKRGVLKGERIEIEKLRDDNLKKYLKKEGESSTLRIKEKTYRVNILKCGKIKKLRLLNY